MRSTVFVDIPECFDGIFGGRQGLIDVCPECYSRNWDCLEGYGFDGINEYVCFDCSHKFKAPKHLSKEQFKVTERYKKLEDLK